MNIVAFIPNNTILLDNVVCRSVANFLNELDRQQPVQQLQDDEMDE